MGLILSKFYNQKPSTRDTLEKIEQEIQNLEESRWEKIKREQFIVQILSFIPITILIANVCFLLYPSESTWRDKLLLSIPMVILNLVLWVSKKIVQWYKRWSLDNEEQRLRKLQKEKRRILDLVCETESYRVATELLEKYDPKQLRRRERSSSDRPTSPLNTTLSKIKASPIKPLQHNQQHMVHNSFPIHNQSINPTIQTQLVAAIQPPAPPPPTPASKPAAKSFLNTTSTNLHNASITSVAASSVQGRPVRPVLSKDRSFFEKMVDWVVADGPDNRFALICRYCYGHNGMSLAEEYETINFRCCYCYNLNTATNKRQVHDQLQSNREKSAEVAENNKKVNNVAKTSDHEENSVQEKLKQGSEVEKPENKRAVGKDDKLITADDTIIERTEELETTNCDENETREESCLNDSNS